MNNKQFAADLKINKVHIPTDYKRHSTWNRAPNLNCTIQTHGTHISDKHMQPNLRAENALCSIARAPLQLLIAFF